MRRFISVLAIASITGLSAVGLAAAAAAPTGASVLGCAPGAVTDTDGIVKVIAKTLRKERKRAEAAIANSNLLPGESTTKEITLSTGVIVRATLSLSADGTTFSFSLEYAQPDPSPTFVEVASGSLSKTTAGDVVTKQETVAVDFDLWRTFIPLKPTGQFSAAETTIKDPSMAGRGVKVTVVASFTNLTIRHDQHGPRTGSYTHVGEPGVGGDLTFHETMPTPCPDDLTIPAAEITAVHRHFIGTDGLAHSRRDAIATGGAIPTGDHVVWLGCGTTSVPRADREPSRYRLRKLEDASGATVEGTITTRNPTDPPCDPAFGPVPALGDNATDYDFSQAVTFPGEW